MLVVVILEKGGPAMKPLNVKTEEVYIYIVQLTPPEVVRKMTTFMFFFFFQIKILPRNALLK